MTHSGTRFLKANCGTRLIHAAIAQQLGISTTPVREALRDLAGERLIHFDTYRGGGVVHSPTLDEVKEVYELRLALAPIAVTKAVPRINERQLDHAMRLVKEMDEERDPGSWVELNRQFHATLDGASESPTLTGILTTLRPCIHSRCPFDSTSPPADDRQQQGAQEDRQGFPQQRC